VRNSGGGDGARGASDRLLICTPTPESTRSPLEPSESGDVTRLLRLAGHGDNAAFEQAFVRVYAELRRLAAQVRGARGPDSLNATALVHEAWLKLAPSSARDWEGRRHFFRAAARAMRQVLVDAARERLADKRGGGVAAVDIDDVAGAIAAPVRDDTILALDEALERLAALDERQARVVELRWFAGFTAEETAEALGISAPTVQRDWRAARAWLTLQLRATGHDAAP
jgi:RNA polymerase sigma factor (TIGR02999 family)